MLATWMLWLMLAGAPACGDAPFCSCAIRPAEVSFARAEAVFAGEVVRTGEMGGEPGQPVALRITRRWKGAAADTVTVHDAHPCGVYFQPGTEYLVYALRGEGGTLYTTFCARTRPLARAGEDLPVLDALVSAAPVHHEEGR